MNRWLTLAALGAGGYVAYQALRPRYDFRGKTVLITGGSRGLGLVMARQLADAGASVAICSRDPAELGRALVPLEASGARVMAIECDATERDRVRELVAVVRRNLGPIDVLINNAGVIGVGPIEHQNREDYERSLQTHFWACLYTCLEVIPEMKARRAGRIVNISSIGGKVAVPHLLPYTVGKFALVGFSNGLRAELAEDGIVVTTVCPGLMRTGSHLNAEFKGRHEEEYAWFALSNGLPGFSMGAERAAGKIITACARGEAEVVLGLPAKLAVAAQAIAPNFTADLMGLVHRYVLPDPGGVGPARVKGRDSRGGLSDTFTALSDRAAVRNNETAPPPLPAGR